MKKAIAVATAFCLLLSSTIAVAAKSNDIGLCESDISLIERAVETTAGDTEFSVAVGIASVLIARFKSKIYPITMLDILNINDDIRIDHSICVSQRSSSAVKYALMGTSPLKDATGAMLITEERDIPYAEYIIIGKWCFYCE